MDSLIHQSFIQRERADSLKKDNYNYTSTGNINEFKDLRIKMDYLLRKFEKIENMRDADINKLKGLNSKAKSNQNILIVSLLLIYLLIY